MKSAVENGCTLEAVQGDLTRQIDVEVLANAANEGLRGGGGVDGAIHRAGGPEILAECRKIGFCATGDAVATPAGRLPVRRIIHTVGPVWRGGHSGEAEKLTSCYRRVLEVALAENLASVAFPSISTGIYGYPVELAAPVAVNAVRSFLQTHSGLRLMRFVLFDRATHLAYQHALFPPAV